LPPSSRDVNGIGTLVPQMQALWRRHEVLANNLANAGTPGFKRDELAVVPGAAAPVTGAAAGAAPTLPSHVPWTSFAQGTIVSTGRPLDVALDGRGFLVVDTPAGARYVRGGSLGVDAAGMLVTASGARVLGQGGPVPVGRGTFSLTERGDVIVNGRRVDTLRVVEFPRAERLSKLGAGMFGATAEPAAASRYTVVGGALEGSNVNVVETMVGMIDVLRQYETAQRILQAEDDAARRASAQIGQVG
jgi:flagellar basal-body rod protein FlgG